ncbi:PfkB domain-containing protein [Catenovulum agarivorans DS-2]|uniref:PfkB domain-containing protein n=1 Tax=Catenovulum agarivorans DS-2 TaxID=1328313 RepID=W7QT96_9ALTE|nr:sugar kinase [Catenovulum agarivorans]EWH08640.1 PfkB domain-containing protein [Catenovulum agarivorans DS-2]
MTGLLVVGEGMVEFKQSENGQLMQKFAGDTLNAGIYAKRWSPNTQVGYFSALGSDMFSDKMREYLASENISADAVYQTDSANIGIYAIQTDEHGERSFTYWRKDSAATQMVDLLLAAGGADQLPAADIIFFSGISLAILSDENKGRLLDILAQAKANGSKIAFDPNYRPRMWRDQSHAIEWIEKAYKLSDIALPGLDEHQDLFEQQTVEAVKNYMLQLGVSEFVIKAGKQGVYGYTAEHSACHVPFNPAPKQLDSTAAGDSFAGTYLVSRVNGQSVLSAIENADKVAREVVQHPGAIMDIELYNKAFK